MEKTHKVGTITLGGMLITFGILFLLRIFVATISYRFIFICGRSSLSS
jgi:UDP-N-acetylmuramyl pentapeptide phosphotransferase/UDP-N-acetylglucosamine-1-phosphate transferase